MYELCLATKTPYVNILIEGLWETWVAGLEGVARGGIPGLSPGSLQCGYVSGVVLQHLSRSYDCAFNSSKNPSKTA